MCLSAKVQPKWDPELHWTHSWVSTGNAVYWTGHQIKKYNVCITLNTCDLFQGHCLQNLRIGKLNKTIVKTCSIFSCTTALKSKNTSNEKGLTSLADRMDFFNSPIIFLQIFMLISYHLFLSKAKEQGSQELQCICFYVIVIAPPSTEISHAQGKAPRNGRYFAEHGWLESWDRPYFSSVTGPAHLITITGYLFSHISATLHQEQSFQNLASFFLILKPFLISQHSSSNLEAKTDILVAWTHGIIFERKQQP